MGEETNNPPPNPPQTTGEKPAATKPQPDSYKDLENGPIKDRCCTDILCWCIFLCGMVYWVFICMYAVSKGKPKQLFAPWDQDSMQCGYSTGYTTHPYGYFYTLMDASTYTSNATGFYQNVFCVSACPSYSGTSTAITSLKAFQDFSPAITCKDTAASLTYTGSMTHTTYSGQTGCSKMAAYDSDPYLGAFCLPSLKWVENVGAAFGAAFSTLVEKFSVIDTVQKWVDDLVITWTLIVGSVVVAILMGVLYCYLLKCFACPITWLVIILVNLIFWLAGWLAYKQAKVYCDESNTVKKVAAASNVTPNTKDIDWNRDWCWAACGIAWFLAFIFLCVTLCCYHKIRLIIHIIEATARFIKDNICILFVPVWNTLLAVVLFVIWMLGSIFLFAVGTITKSSSGYPWSDVAWTDFTKYSWYFNLFWGLWLMAFCLSLNVFVIAAAVCVWYFQVGAEDCEEKKEKPEGQPEGENQDDTQKDTRGPIMTGYCWAMCMHMGSIAFGSFILAVVWMLQLIAYYMEKKMKESGETVSENKFVKCLIKCVQCCLLCLERCVKFVNKQAFIHVALSGKNFCVSAKNGIINVLNHPIHFALLACLGNAFAWVGILVITFGTGVLAWLVMTQTTYYNSVSSMWFPIAICGALGYCVGRLFSCVFLVACYAILHCFFLDVDLNGEKGKPPRFTPSELQEFVEDAKK